MIYTIEMKQKKNQTGPLRDFRNCSNNIIYDSSYVKDEILRLKLRLFHDFQIDSVNVRYQSMMEDIKSYLSFLQSLSTPQFVSWRSSDFLTWIRYAKRSWLDLDLLGRLNSSWVSSDNNEKV